MHLLLLYLHICVRDQLVSVTPGISITKLSFYSSKLAPTKNQANSDAASVNDQDEEDNESSYSMTDLD